jgi:D-alanyl-D-alanine-carboxypeptidase/D-alanyl-D-alanine-endopeptidase
MLTCRSTQFLFGLILSCATAFAQVPSDTAIRKILAERVGSENLGMGIVVGVIDANGRRVVAYGSLAKNDNRRLDGDTVFEIGSMSKVFTSLLLMDMTRRGEVALADPVAKYLPAGVAVPERNNRRITLADLSTQSSGLPRMPTNFNPKDELNPFADYSVQQLYDFLSGYQLKRDIGSQYEYSNVGVGLLGHALALRAGMSYEALVRSRICDPLGMANTRITLTPGMRARLAVGHNASLIPVPNWDMPTLPGAGALRSTVNDLLIFLGANLGYVKTPLAQAMADEVSIRRPADALDLQIAYAWHIQTRNGNSIIVHSGGTGGYRTYMGFDPKARVGVVVLANLTTSGGPNDIGQHLLDASYPLLKANPPVERKEITIGPKTFDRYVGTYRLGPYALIPVSRAGDRFYAQLPGQPNLQVYAETDQDFFFKVIDGRLTFDFDPTVQQGAATRVTIHQNGRDRVANRLSEAEAKRAMDEIQSHNADVEKRFSQQTQTPGTDAAVRRSIQELQRGESNYDLMSAELAETRRQQLPQLKTAIMQFGALQSVTFKGVGAGGDDIYEVKFEHATTEWKLSLSRDGKTQNINFRPL